MANGSSPEEALDGPHAVATVPGFVRDQCDFVIAADGDLRAALAQDAFPNNQRVWFAIQNLLTAAANLSKASWGLGGKLGPERADLRSSLGVSDASPLNTTLVRDHFEHFDQRLDIWFRDSPNHIHVDRVFAAHGGYTIQGPTPNPEIFRGFDPHSGIVTFWDHEIDLGAIVAEARRIGPLAVAQHDVP